MYRPPTDADDDDLEIGRWLSLVRAAQKLVYPRIPDFVPRNGLNWAPCSGTRQWTCTRAVSCGADRNDEGESPQIPMSLASVSGAVQVWARWKTGPAPIYWHLGSYFSPAPANRLA